MLNRKAANFFGNKGLFTFLKLGFCRANKEKNGMPDVAGNTEWQIYNLLLGKVTLFL